MRFLRSSVLATAAACAALGLAACGGGGGGSGGGSVGTAALRGTVVSVDGSTQSLGGIFLRDPRTGQTVTTGSNGSFNFGTVPAGTITLRVLGTTALVSTAAETVSTSSEGSDDHESGENETHDATAHEGDHETGDDDGAHEANDDGDDDDVGDDDADVANVSDGENVNVNVTIEDGEITSIEVSCSRGDERRAQIALTPGAETDDLDATGSARFALNDERSCIRIVAEDLTPGRVVEWFMLDLGGTAESEGTRVVDEDGEAVWKVSTKEGGTLPFGVASVADLEGFQIEIRDATTGTVLLFGTVPALPLSAPHEDGEDEGEDEGIRARGEAMLVATAAGEAEVEVESRTGEEATEKIEFEVEALPAGTMLDVFLENPATPGTLEKVGSITIGGEGEGELEFDTHDGDTLPFGAANVAALAGMAIEIRATDGTVLFSGHVPVANVVEHDD